MSRCDGRAWKSPVLVEKYLKWVRKAVPLSPVQIEMMMRVISSREGGVHSFLDLGCGNGILAAAILHCFPKAKGVLLDFSLPMIEAAQRKLRTFSRALEYVIADYGDPGWIDSVASSVPFDVVVSGFSIHHQQDRRKQTLYNEIYKVLKPGGIFLNLDHVSSPTKWVKTLFDNYFIDSLHSVLAKKGFRRSREQIVSEYYERPDKAANILAPVEVQCHWLRQIGFEDVDCYFKVFELALFGGRRPL